MSRRALRESERAVADATVVPPAVPQSANYASDQGILQDSPAQSQPEFRAHSRHSAPDAQQQMRRPRASENRQESGEIPRFRVRDYSPEARGEAFSTTTEVPPGSPPVRSEGNGFRPRVRTEATIAEQVAPAIVEPPKVVTEAAEPQSTQLPTEQTLSRRELRAIRDAALGNVGAPAEQSVAAVAPESPIAPSVGEAMPNAYSAPQVVPDLIQPPTDWLTKPTFEPSAPTQFQPQFPAAGSVKQAPPEERIATQEPSFPAPSVLAPSVPAQSVPAPSVPEASVPIREVVTAPEVYETAPTHWSRQPEIDDQFASLIGHHSRDIAASGAITTSALVMPNFPSTDTITAPLGETGEILLTGTVNLPRSLATSGYNRSRFDSSDLDTAADPRDREIASMDSAPVRASDAVSTHTSTQSVLVARRPKGSKLVMALSITGAAMGIGVILLFAAGMIFKIF